MGRIVKFDQCMEAEKEKRQVERIKKLTAVKKILECTKCALKCTRCGTQVALSQSPSFSRDVPYRFCASCEDEYRDFLERKRGGDRKEFYWHNREWMATWEAWIQYQRAMRKYENSNEFKQLLYELRRNLG